MCASDRTTSRGTAALLGLALGTGLALAPQAGWAQSKKEQEQVRRLRQQVQQLQQAQGSQDEALNKALQDNAALSTQARQADQSRSAAAAANRKAAALSSDLAAAKAAQSTLEQALAEARAQLAQTQAALGQAQEQGQTRQRELTQVRADLDSQTTRWQTCRTHNAALVGIGEELLDRYTQKGVAESMTAQEPFLQLKRVTLENLAQDYEDRIRQERLPRTTTTPES